MTRAEGWSPVYRVVRRIPCGQVATYGQVAAMAGMPRAARQVGWALNALDAGDDVPWHRVINAKGEVSTRGEREIEGQGRVRTLQVSKFRLGSSEDPRLCALLVDHIRLDTAAVPNRIS